MLTKRIAGAGTKERGVTSWSHVRPRPISEWERLHTYTILYLPFRIHLDDKILTMDTNSSNASSHRPSMEDTFDNLYPSLLQCFTVILLGYCLGRLGYISPTSSKGIGVFVSLVSLPALLFKSMVELDFSQVNWRFLFSILIAKSTVFVVVVLFTLILVRPTNLGRAGIYGIFSTQSNDLALGYPLRKSQWQFVECILSSYTCIIKLLTKLFLAKL